MLALANVLLLRNQIHLSPDAPDVTQVCATRQPALTHRISVFLCCFLMSFQVDKALSFFRCFQQRLEMLTHELHLQERLLSLIAGHLLDVNSKQDINEEQQANMMQNIADAVELLPKLTTGIDVNIIFNDVRGFEVRADPIPFLCMSRASAGASPA